MYRIKYSHPLKLDIGCGKHKKEGYTGIDILDRGQEILWDIRGGIPVPDDSVVEVRTSHFVEHLEVKDLKKFFDELIRVCQNGCEILITCPHADTAEARFPCHLSFWEEKTIDGICQDSSNLLQSGEYPGKFEKIEATKQGIELISRLKVLK